MKTKTLEIPLYYTPEGQPTCAVDFQNGEVCKFYRYGSYGFKDVCSWTNEVLKRRHVEGHGNCGNLIPCKECILHNEDNNDKASD